MRSLPITSPSRQSRSLSLSLPLSLCPFLPSFLPSGIHTVEGIAVDWMAGNLYWTDDGPMKTISVARLEKASQTRKTLIEGKMTHPRAIVVDPQHGSDIMPSLCSIAIVYISHRDITL